MSMNRPVLLGAICVKSGKKTNDCQKSAAQISCRRRMSYGSISKNWFPANARAGLRQVARWFAGDPAPQGKRGTLVCTDSGDRRPYYACWGI